MGLQLFGLPVSRLVFFRPQTLLIPRFLGLQLFGLPVSIGIRALPHIRPENPLNHILSRHFRRIVQVRAVRVFIAGLDGIHDLPDVFHHFRRMGDGFCVKKLRPPRRHIGINGLYVSIFSLPEAHRAHERLSRGVIVRDVVAVLLADDQLRLPEITPEIRILLRHVIVEYAGVLHDLPAQGQRPGHEPFPAHAIVAAAAFYEIVPQRLDLIPDAFRIRLAVIGFENLPAHPVRVCLADGLLFRGLHLCLESTHPLPQPVIFLLQLLAAAQLCRRCPVRRVLAHLLQRLLHGDLAIPDLLRQLFHQRVVRPLAFQRKISLDILPGFGYTSTRKSVSVLNLGHFSPLIDEFGKALSVFCVKNISFPHQVSDVLRIKCVKYGIYVVIDANRTGGVDPDGDDDRIPGLRLPVGPDNNAVVSRRRVVRGVPRDRQRVLQLIEELIQDYPPQPVFPAVFSFGEDGFFHGFLGNIQRVVRSHVLRDDGRGFAHENNLVAVHRPIQHLGDLALIPCHVLRCRRIHRQGFLAGRGLHVLPRAFQAVFADDLTADLLRLRRLPIRLFQLAQCPFGLGFFCAPELVYQVPEHLGDALEDGGLALCRLDELLQRPVVLEKLPGIVRRHLVGQLVFGVGDAVLVRQRLGGFQLKRPPVAHDLLDRRLIFGIAVRRELLDPVSDLVAEEGPQRIFVPLFDGDQVSLDLGVGAPARHLIGKLHHDSQLLCRSVYGRDRLLIQAVGVFGADEPRARLPGSPFSPLPPRGPVRHAGPALPGVPPVPWGPPV